MHVFVTGSTGFAGSHLVDQLLEEGHDVTALVHSSSSHQQLPDGVIAIEGDLLDQAGMKAALSQAQPEVVYHLAGLASPGQSWANPALTLAVNAGGVANLLQACLNVGKPRVVVVTSADLYGPVQPDMLPLTEETQPKPRHPYGISKMAAGLLTRLYWERYQLPVIEALPFNHVGPRQSLGFVASDFASQIAGIKLGQLPPRIMVGNLDAERDFTDVRDVVRAYCRLARLGQPGEAYFICSGQPVPIHYLLTALLETAGVAVEVVSDPERMRPSDTPVLFGSSAKIRQHTGWQPHIHLRQSLADTLDWWLGQLADGEAA